MNANGPFEAFDNSNPYKMTKRPNPGKGMIHGTGTDWAAPAGTPIPKEGGKVVMSPLESIEIGNGFLPEETGGELEMNLNLQTIINAFNSPKSIVTAKRDPLKGINILIENYDEKEFEEWATEKANEGTTKKPIEHRFELMLYNSAGWLVDEFEQEMPFPTIENAKEAASQLFEDFEDLAFIKIREIVIAKENSDVIDREFLFPGFDKKNREQEGPEIDCEEGSDDEKPAKLKGKVLRKNIRKAEDLANYFGSTPILADDEQTFGYFRGFRDAIKLIKGEEKFPEIELKEDGF